jgi:hypothetical protein
VLGVFVRLELATLDLNADTAEGKVIDVHNISSGVRSRALLGGDGGENGPALLHFSAAAVWAGDVSFLVVSRPPRKISYIHGSRIRRWGIRASLEENCLKGF